MKEAVWPRITSSHLNYIKIYVTWSSPSHNCDVLPGGPRNISKCNATRLSKMLLDNWLIFYWLNRKWQPEVHHCCVSNYALCRVNNEGTVTNCVCINLLLIIVNMTNNFSLKTDWMLRCVWRLPPIKPRVDLVISNKIKLDFPINRKLYLLLTFCFILISQFLRFRFTATSNSGPHKKYQ